jgi:probable phosphoglycerate mutase
LAYKTRVVLIRHGQTAWNRESRYRGQADVELDAFGVKQAEATARYVAARWPVAAVYASPLSRTMRTAEAIAGAQGLTAQPLEGLLDIDFGEFQGLRPEDAARRFAGVHRAWVEEPHTVCFPGGESLDVVRSRVAAALDRVADQHGGETVALVSHTVVIRVLLCIVLGWGNERFWRMEQDTCAVNVFDVGEDGGFRIRLLNDTGHLRALWPTR